MPTLTIKGLPENLYRRLKDQAEAHRRSLNGEVIVCLERAVAGGPVDPEAWLEDVEAFRAGLKGRALSRAQVRRARTSGRS